MVAKARFCLDLNSASFALLQPCKRCYEKAGRSISSQSLEAIPYQFRLEVPEELAPCTNPDGRAEHPACVPAGPSWVFSRPGCTLTHTPDKHTATWSVWVRPSHLPALRQANILTDLFCS